VDARTRKLVGWVIVAAGIVVAAVGAFADQIGLGGDGADDFGGKQVAALIVGIVIAVVGLGLALWSGRPGSNEPSAAAPTETSA
jgi:hypothetical protein